MPKWAGFFGSPEPQGPQYGPAVSDTQGFSMTPESDYWSQPSVAGMPRHRLVTMTGLLANALAPNSVGGRMGRAAAGMAGNYGNVALRGEQQTRQAMAVEAWKAKQERQRQQTLGGLLSRVGRPQAGGFGIREGQPQAPGAQPSMFGVPPVATNLEGVSTAPGPAPKITIADIAQLAGLVEPNAFKAITDQWAWGGQMPNTEPLKPMMGKPGEVPVNVNTGELIGSGVPLLASQAAPPETNVRSNRPAFSARGVDYPAQVGLFAAPPASTIVQGDQPLWVAQPTVQQSTMPQGGTLPPANRDPNVTLTAPFKPFSPREQAVNAPAGSTTWLTPGGPPKVAAPTYRQRTVSVPAGGSAVTEGKVTPAPQTEVQRGAAGKATAGKAPTQGAQLVTAQLNKIIALQPKNAVVGPFGGWVGGGTEAQSVEDQVDGMKANAPDAVTRRAIEIAWDQYLRGQMEDNPAVGGAPAMEGRVYVNPKTKERIVKRNGQWVPYAP